MFIIAEVIVMLINTASLFFLYFRISGIKLTWSQCLLSFFANFIFELLLGTLFSNSLVGYLGYLSSPLYFVIFSLVVSKSLPSHLSIFYGLFPVILWNLLHRLLAFFVIPIFGWTYQQQMGRDKFILVISSFVASLLSLWIPSLLHYNFKRLREFKLNEVDKRLIIFLNISMLLYYAFVQVFAFLETFYQVVGLPYRELIVVIYIILFLSSVNILDRNLRERIQQELSHQKEIQLQNMADYSQHIEDLYNELRGFRHDYINILRSLRLGIENKDLPAIERVYNEVLEGTGEPLNQSKYDLGRLYNINNDALKSLLSAKFLEAQNKKIMAGIEVPQPIEPQGMELLDILTVLSILIDNAIEAAVAARKATLSIACIKQEGEQIFIVENSTQENVVDTSKIFERGISSKGKNRGIGLSNVQKIISRYPNVSLRTVSQDHLFRQEMEIKLSGNK